MRTKCCCTLVMCYSLPSGHVNEGCHNYWIETCGKWRSPEFHQNQAGSSHLMNSKGQKNCGSHLRQKEKYKIFLSQYFFFYFDDAIKIQRVPSRYVFLPLSNLVLHLVFFPPNCIVTMLNEGKKLYS